MTPAVLLYTRISENRSDETEKTDRQEELGRRFAEQEGAEVVGVYCDDNVSGSKLLQRKQWNRMWEDAAELAQGDRPVWIVARDTDRLTRNKRECIDVMDKVEETGVRIRTYDRAFDTDRPEWEDDLMYRVMGGERYSRAITKNQQLKQQQLREEGAWRGGPRPFGYYPTKGTKLRNGVVRPAYDQTKVRKKEAKLIKAGTLAVINGASAGTVAKAWNESGVKTSMGKEWTGQAVKSVLVRWRNAGLLEHNGTVLGPAQWPAIVSREDVAAVREALRSETVKVPENGRGAPARIQPRKTRPAAPREHLLSGVLTCGCGGRMNQKQVGKNQQYACKTCHRGIDYAVANERVTGYVVARLAAGDAGIKRKGGDNLARLGELASELAGLTEKQGKLQAAEDAGTIDYDVFLAQSAKIKARRDEIEAERGRIRRQNAIAGLIDGVRPSTALAPTQDRELARAEVRRRFDALSLVEKVTVMRALGVYTVTPHPKGVRPTKESARHRIAITVLDPSTGEPYVYEADAI